MKIRELHSNIVCFPNFPPPNVKMQIGGCGLMTNKQYEVSQYDFTLLYLYKNKITTDH